MTIGSGSGHGKQQRVGRAGAAIGLFGCGDGLPQDIPALRSALRRERARGRAGHWTYDITRHLALATRLKRAERAHAEAHAPVAAGGRRADADDATD